MVSVSHSCSVKPEDPRCRYWSGCLVVDPLSGMSSLTFSYDASSQDSSHRWHKEDRAGSDCSERDSVHISYPPAASVAAIFCIASSRSVCPLTTVLEMCVTCVRHASLAVHLLPCIPSLPCCWIVSVDGHVGRGSRSTIGDRSHLSSDRENVLVFWMSPVVFLAVFGFRCGSRTATHLMCSSLFSASGAALGPLLTCCAPRCFRLQVRF